MSKLSLLVILHIHILILPVFQPTIGGIRTANLQISNSISWHGLILHREVQIPDGALIKFKYRFS